MRIILLKKYRNRTLKKKEKFRLTGENMAINTMFRQKIQLAGYNWQVTTGRLQLAGNLNPAKKNSFNH